MPATIRTVQADPLIEALVLEHHELGTCDCLYWHRINDGKVRNQHLLLHLHEDENGATHYICVDCLLNEINA